MNNAVFRNTMENVRKHRDIKPFSSKRRINYLVSESNYYTTKFFTKNLLAIEMKKTQIIMNKPVYLGLSILDISKTKMYDFWYNYIKGKYGEKANICYMDTGSFNVHLKTDDIHKDIAGDVETRLDPSNYEKIDRCLWDFKKVIRLMKGELGRKIMTIFVELKPIVLKIELKPIENKTS